MTERATTLKRTTLAAAATTAVIGGLLAAGAASAATADTGTAVHTGAVAAPVTQASLLRLDQIDRAGLAVDSAVLGTRGDQLLGDAGRFDEGCLGEKTMRNITGSKSYPAPAEAAAYVDATWTSTLDKDVWVSESVATGRTSTATSRYVRILLDEIRDVRSCEQDPAQGDYYGPAHRVRVGSATGVYFLDHESDGSSAGGGVAVVRDGNAIGFVDLMFGHGRTGSTLRQLTVAAAGNLR